MLRCAGCGSAVSEWAARCPACHRGTDDAVLLAEPEPTVGTTDRPDAAEDRPVAAISPTTSRARSRPFGVIGGTVGLAATTALIAGLTIPGSAKPDPPIPAAISSLAGRVVAETTDGTLLLSDVAGRHRVVLASRPFAAGDRPELVDADQALVAITGDRLADSFADTDRALAAALPASATIAPFDPLANRGRAVVVLTSRTGSSTTALVSVDPIGSGAPIALGAAHNAAGDPQSLGAFVTIAAPRRPNDVVPGGLDAVPDTRVELRDSGGPPVLLATAGELDQDVQQDPSQRVNLGIFPDVDGQKVAVELNPVGGAESNSAVVVLNRQGRVLDVVNAAFGPTEYTPVYWSPDGSSLAYATIGTVGTALAVYSRTETGVQSLASGTSLNGCAWSPDSSWIVCLADSPSAQNWVLARRDPTLSPIYSIPGRGTPLAWLP